MVFVTVNTDNIVMEYAGTVETEAINRMKAVVLDSLTSKESKRSYQRAIDRFINWMQVERPSTAFNKATVQAFRAYLIARGLASSTVNLYLTALRRLAGEASDNSLMAADLAAGIGRVKGMRREGAHIGNWLTAPEAERFIEAPDVGTLKGRRDKALLAVMIGCGLRRQEVASLMLESVQEREGRSVIVDLLGKGRRRRSIPVPLWAKESLDIWTKAACIHSGRIFRPVNKADRLSGVGMTAQSVFVAVRRYAKPIKAEIVPHDLRRSFARLAHAGNSPIEQIQLSLGHQSIVTTLAYIGVRQDLRDAPGDHLGLNVSSADTGQR
jgi:site-specific recombinase XerD